MKAPSQHPSKCVSAAAARSKAKRISAVKHRRVAVAAASSELNDAAVDVRCSITTAGAATMLVAAVRRYARNKLVISNMYGNAIHVAAGVPIELVASSSCSIPKLSLCSWVSTKKAAASCKMTAASRAMVVAERPGLQSVLRKCSSPFKVALKGTFMEIEWDDRPRAVRFADRSSLFSVRTIANCNAMSKDDWDDLYYERAVLKVKVKRSEFEQTYEYQVLGRLPYGEDYGPSADGMKLHRALLKMLKNASSVPPRALETIELLALPKYDYSKIATSRAAAVAAKNAAVRRMCQTALFPMLFLVAALLHVPVLSSNPTQFYASAQVLVRLLFHLQSLSRKMNAMSGHVLFVSPMRRRCSPFTRFQTVT